MRHIHQLILTDACSAARLRVRPELITEVEAAMLELPSGERLPVALVRLAPARMFGHVETPERGVTLVVDEPATWIRRALETIERTRAKNARNRLPRSVGWREPVEVSGSELVRESSLTKE